RLVGRVGQFDEGDALAGMAAVPALEQGAEIAGEVPGRGQGELAAPAGGALVGLCSGGHIAGEDDDQDEEAPTRGMDPPHRFLPVHRHPGTLVRESEAMYTG